MEKELEILLDRFAERVAAKAGCTKAEALDYWVPERFSMTEKQKKYALAYLRKEVGDVH